MLLQFSWKIICKGDCMKILKGKGASGQIAFGKLYFAGSNTKSVKRYKIEDAEKEIKKYRQSVKTALKELDELYEKAIVEVGETNAEIFNMHKVMLEDEDFCDSVINIIESQQVNAEFAVASTGENFARMFSSMDDAYMKERSKDVKDITERLVRIISGEKDAFEELKDACIVAAEDLTPSETVKMDKSKVMGIVTRKGSLNSHTAILARSMGIPAIVDILDLSEEYAGKYVIADGFDGKLYIEPDDFTVDKYIKQKEEQRKKEELLEKLKGIKCKTSYGKEIMLYANIGDLSEVANCLENDAEGIGLFRSEFLYLKSDREPSEEEQFIAYKTVAENMGGRRVIIRTMDIGADKQADYLNLKKETNPALGYRAIRICLDRPSMFKKQLSAILRAAAYGKIAVMFPMITSAEEIISALKYLEEVKTDLAKNGIPFDENIETGIMIETPAAALISDKLAKYVKFFSIGTNDLTQYTLACDRENMAVEKYVNPYHESIFRLIEMTVNAAHENGIWAGVCGELASDLNSTEKLLELGVDELSVSPASILPLKEKILNI